MLLWRPGEFSRIRRVSVLIERAGNRLANSRSAAGHRQTTCVRFGWGSWDHSVNEPCGCGVADGPADMPPHTLGQPHARIVALSAAVGEKVDDLEVFDADNFVNALIDE